MADEQLTRRQWRKGAVKALLGSTTPGGRFLMLRAGFLQFQTVAGPSFSTLAGFTFTSAELRRIWDDLGAYVLEHERELQPKFERAYQRNLHKNPERPSDPSDTPGDGIIVENYSGRVQ